MSAAAEAINPPNVKAAWPSAPLRSLCEFHNGLWKGKKGPFETATVIRNTNFTLDGRIDLSDVAVLEVEARQLAKRRLQKNDIIIEKSGGGPKQPVGRVVLFDLDVDEKYSFSNFTSAIRVVKPSEIDPAFLHRVLYWWYTSGRTEAIQSHSTGIRNLDFNAYKDLVVPLPPLEEQKRIVAILDQAFAALDRARALAEANLADARALFKIKLDSTFKSFASKECRIDELFEVGSSKRVLKSEWKDSGVPFYRGREVTRLAQEGRVDNELFISESHYDELAAKTGVPSPGDILITAIGTIGNAYIVQEGDRFYFKDASVLWMRRTSEVLSAYVKLWIRSSSFYDQLERGNGATVDTLTIGKLQGLLIPNFPEKDQERIVEDLIALERKVGCLESLYKSKLTDLANLRQSLLQKAFSGQLT